MIQINIVFQFLECTIDRKRCWTIIIIFVWLIYIGLTRTRHRDPVKCSLKTDTVNPFLES